MFALIWLISGVHHLVLKLSKFEIVLVVKGLIFNFQLSIGVLHLWNLFQEAFIFSGKFLIELGTFCNHLLLLFAFQANILQLFNYLVFKLRALFQLCFKTLETAAFNHQVARSWLA